MFVSGIGGGSILLLCLLDFITVLTVWLSICLLVVSVVALFYDCVYLYNCSDSVVVYMFVSGIGVALFYNCVY